MSRSSFRLCRVCSRLHDLDEPWPAACAGADVQRSSLAAPMLIRDGMDPVQSMLDGKMYDSKRTLRATYKAAGVTEIGNDKPKPFVRPRADRKKIKASVERGFSRAGFGA